MDELSDHVASAGVDFLGVVQRRRRRFTWQATGAAALILTLFVVGVLSTQPDARPLPWLSLALAVLGILVGLIEAFDATKVAPDGNVYGAFRTSNVEDLMWEAEDAVIRPHVRRVLNRHLDAEFEPVLTVAAVPGLRDARADRFVVTTAAFREASDRIGELDTGAVIVTGTRGTGKSALIKQVLAERPGEASIPGGISVLVPSRYDARDFILHLHAVSCRAVIDHVLSELRWRALDSVASRLRPMPAVLGLLVGLGAVLVQSLTALPVGSGPWRVVVLCAGAVLAATGLAGAAVAVAARLANLRGPGSILALARADLNRVRYLQTFTVGWSGKLAVPWGEASADRSRQVAEQARSLPEVVTDFRSFVTKLIAGQHRLVIAIDELDKLADATQAEQFIEDIRAILDIPGCVYLTAMSDDAMVHFGRRISTTKTSLDSSFDLAVRMRPMTAAESSDALATRVVGFSKHFRLLTHLAAGGRPRELVRVARKLVDHTRSTGGLGIADGARLLLADLADEHLHAMAIALRTSNSGVGSVRVAVHAISPGGDLDDYENVIRLLASNAPDADPLRWELVAFHGYLTTLRRFFDCPHPAAELLDDKGQPTATVALLERALRLLPDDPVATWAIVDDIRVSAGLVRLVDNETTTAVGQDGPTSGLPQAVSLEGTTHGTSANHSAAGRWPTLEEGSA